MSKWASFTNYERYEGVTSPGNGSTSTIPDSVALRADGWLTAEHTGTECAKLTVSAACKFYSDSYQ